MQTLFDIQRATVAARERAGDKTIGTDVQAGMFRVVRVRYENGIGVVEPLTTPMPAVDAIATLDGMQ